MPEVTIRPKGQLTIPAEILRNWHLQTSKVNITLVNGVLMITPVNPKEEPKTSIMDFAGIGHGLWGDTPEEVETSINELRNSWNR